MSAAPCPDGNMIDTGVLSAGARRMPSVQPEWMRWLPLQQQSVLLLAARGPDGIPKTHPCKEIQRAYRGTVLVAARFNRCLRFGEHADSFMSLRSFVSEPLWNEIMKDFFNAVDELPHHYTLHLLHGAEILGFKHPDPRFRGLWGQFYIEGCVDMHLTPETEDQLDRRLGDWGGLEWSTTDQAYV